MTRTRQSTARHRLISRFAAIVFAGALVSAIATACAAADPPATKDSRATTGPETEKRFPPLKLPSGFQATLFACDPLIEYPSAIARGPAPGTLFIADDYMTGLGFEIIRRDEIRLLEDTNGDGYADRAIKYADGFNSIQGMTFDGETLYVMHAPFLTVLRDTNRDGTVDNRQDLLSGLGLPPEENPHRLHCANGVTAGHDGWLYLALGDHGCRVPRPEGDTLVLEGGGILRCRPDGTDLHVFSKGLRNIYDVALDAEQNVFVRDNENDGGTYKQRMIFSVHGADHGYPYLYEEHPDEAMPPLADLGLGSSAGGVCYLENQFPAEYRGNLFWCEWGRAVMRYPLRREGASFASEKEIEFAAGADEDPYPFKPTDLVVDSDGSLFVSDWCDGQRPVRGRGRIYRIRYVGDASKQSAGKATTRKPAASPANNEVAAIVRQLDSPSYAERCSAQRNLVQRGATGAVAAVEAVHHGKLGPRGRGHAVWCIAEVAGADSETTLLNIATDDDNPGVRIQAIRAWADRFDPVLVTNRLDMRTDFKFDAIVPEWELASILAGSINAKDKQVFLEAVTALGRLRWPTLIGWLSRRLHGLDPVTAHAVLQAVRRSDDLPGRLKQLGAASDDSVRRIFLSSLADEFDPAIVEPLIQGLDGETNAARRKEYVDLLTRVYKRPGPWVYWGYRPLPRPAGSESWELTESIASALDRLIISADAELQANILKRMNRGNVATRVDTLARMAAGTKRPETIAAMLEALASHPADAARPTTVAVAADVGQAAENRLRALAMLTAKIDAGNAEELGRLAAKLEDGPVLAELIRKAAGDKRVAFDDVLRRTLESTDPELVAATIEGLTMRRSDAAAAAVERHLGTTDARIRRAAVTAAGELRLSGQIDRLVAAAADPDPPVRRAALVSLRRLRTPRALAPALAALADPETSIDALDCLGELGGPEQAAAIVDLAKRRPTPETVASVGHILSAWSADSKVADGERSRLLRYIAEIQAGPGVIVGWSVRDPKRPGSTEEVSAEIASEGPAGAWTNRFTIGPEGRLKFDSSVGEPSSAWWAYTDLAVATETEIECRTSSDGPLEIRLNDKIVFRRERSSTFRVDAEQFTAVLRPGHNRLLVRIDPAPGKTAEFHLRFRRKSSKAEHERLIQAALARSGDVDRGRELFFAAEKSLCIKCHRLDGRGEKIGPELTGVGGRFSKVYIVESILEPSRTIAPSFETISVALADGRTVTGVRTAETETTLTLADNEGKQHAIAKAEIEEREVRPTSTMVEGLEKRFSVEQFVDLVAFLVSRRAQPKP